MSRFLFTPLITLLWVLAAPTVQASCPKAVLKQNANEPWAALYQRLMPYKEPCYHDADYLALLGAASLRIGHTREAALLLERSLMLGPNQAGAAIDYAQALFTLRQPFAALELNQQLLTQAETQPPLNAFLRKRQQHWHEALTQSSTQLHLQAGYDTNLGRTSDLSTLDLTLPDGLLTLALAPDQQPTAGSSLYWGLEHRISRLLPDGSLHLYGQLEGRESTDSTYNRLELNLGVARRYQWQPHSLTLGAGLTHYNLEQQDLYSALATHATYAHDTGNACTPLLSGSAQIRRFPSNHTLDGTLVRLSAGSQCQLGQLELSLVGGIRADLAQTSTRAGGDRWGYDLALLARLPLTTGTLEGSLQHTGLRDETGYSRLLRNNQRRHTDFTGLELSYTHQLGPQQALSFSARHLYQSSNIELFELNASEIRLGWHLNF